MSDANIAPTGASDAIDRAGSPDDDPPFKRRTVMWMAGIVVVSFVAAILIAIFSDAIGTTSSSSTDTFSRSAIGHRGFVNLLARLGIPVLVSEHDSASKVQQDAVLMVAEPIVLPELDDRGDALTRMVSNSPVSLVVLPKWFGIPDESKPGWISDVELLGTDEGERVLGAVGIGGTVYRNNTSSRWLGADGDNLFSLPTLRTPQLISSGDIEPVITTADGGILLGMREFMDGRLLWVLSDPDILSNHGLKRGQNAVLAVEIIEMVRSGTGTVVIDETLHGFQKEPSIWRALFEFPLALATIQALMAVVLLLWASTGRFGKPLAPAPTIEPGKAFLINNTATLLRFGRHAGDVVLRYLHAAIQDVCHALHAPHDMTEHARRKWLSRIEKSRRVTRALTDLEREVTFIQSRRASDDRAVRAARSIHRWRQEMIHGSHSRQRD